MDFNLIFGILKLSFGLIFFNYGYGKLIKLTSGEGAGLIGMVSSIPIFSIFPLFFAWSLALTETFVIFALIYGYFVAFCNDLVLIL